MLKLLRNVIILLLIPCFAHAGGAMGLMVAGGSAAAAAAPCTGASPTDCIARETFNGASACGDGSHTNCDNSWASISGWMDFNGGTINSSTAATAGGGTVLNSLVTTAADELYGAARVKSSAVAGNILAIYNSTNTTACVATWEGGSTGKWQISNSGGTTVVGTTVRSVDTEYYIKIRAKLGTGANAECQLWGSSDGVTWTAEAESTNGTWTTQRNKVVTYGSAGTTSAFDDVRIYTGNISW